MVSRAPRTAGPEVPFSRVTGEVLFVSNSHEQFARLAGILKNEHDFLIQNRFFAHGSFFLCNCSIAAPETAIRKKGKNQSCS